MRTIKVPATFLEQRAGGAAAFNTLPAVARSAADRGHKGVQLPSWDARLFDLERSAGSQDHCDEVRGTPAEAGLELNEPSRVRLPPRAEVALAVTGRRRGVPSSIPAVPRRRP